MAISLKFALQTCFSSYPTSPSSGVCIITQIVDFYGDSCSSQLTLRTQIIDIHVGTDTMTKPCNEGTIFCTNERCLLCFAFFKRVHRLRRQSPGVFGLKC